jgi:hypothetical protein
LVAPTLTFNVSTSNVAFDPLNNTNSYTDTKSITLTTSTNAYNGYEIHQYMNGLMTNGTNTIPAFNGGSYASPDSWQSGDIGLGYTSSDSSVAGANKFQAATCPGGSAIAAPGCYAPFTLSSPGAIVADHTAAVTATPITNETFTITFRLTTSATQPAGNYLGTITYSAIASF